MADGSAADDVVDGLDCGASPCATMLVDAIRLPADEEPYWCDPEGDGGAVNGLAGVLGLVQDLGIVPESPPPVRP